MASDIGFVDYVRDQIGAAGNVAVKKMFGEYAIYLDDKVVALVCDNQFFVRPTAAGRALLGRVTEAPPYPGAKPHLLITDKLEDHQLVAKLVRVTAAELPAPKPKKARK
jgi:TfoX/Sxy family transcriptional regulator of competence genes